MKLQFLAPLALTIAWLGGTIPVSADHQRPRYSRSDSGRRDEALENRAQSISRRAHDLYNRGSLSRDHLERTLAKLDRVIDDVDGNGRISNDRFQSHMRWMSQVEDTMHEWSRADSGRGERGRRLRRR